MSLVIVGSVGLDTIETPVGKVVEALGGSAVYGALAASKFTTTHIVGVIGDDFPLQHINLLKENKIILDGLETLKGKTFRWHGRYNTWNQAHSLNTELNVFADFNPVLPPSYLHCNSLLLGNIHPDLQLQVLSQVKNYCHLACDTMNYWISTCKAKVLEVIKKVSIVFINEDELRMLTGVENIFQAAREVLNLGPEMIVVKRGEYGAVLIKKDMYFFVPAYPIMDVQDPTGAGDCFAGGFMGYLASQTNVTNEHLRTACRFGTITAAINVSSFSVDNIAEVSIDTINAMYEELQSWT